MARSVCACAVSTSNGSMVRAGEAPATRRKRDEKLLAGLSALLSSFDAEDNLDEPDDGNDDDADESAQVLAALRGILARKPKNVLQELKALVARFTRVAPAPARRVRWDDGLPSFGTQGKGKGKGGHSTGAPLEGGPKGSGKASKGRADGQGPKSQGATRPSSQWKRRKEDWGAQHVIDDADSLIELLSADSTTQDKVVFCPRSFEHWDNAVNFLML
eukprot:s9681_g3.t1